MLCIISPFFIVCSLSSLLPVCLHLSRGLSLLVLARLNWFSLSFRLPFSSHVLIFFQYLCIKQAVRQIWGQLEAEPLYNISNVLWGGGGRTLTFRIFCSIKKKKKTSSPTLSNLTGRSWARAEWSSMKLLPWHFVIWYHPCFFTFPRHAVGGKGVRGTLLQNLIHMFFYLTSKWAWWKKMGTKCKMPLCPRIDLLRLKPSCLSP